MHIYNFISLQQRSPDFVVYIIHSVAAKVVFGIGFLYCVLQTVISNQVENETLGNHTYLRRLRIAILGPNAILAIICILYMKKYIQLVILKQQLYNTVTGQALYNTERMVDCIY